MGTVGIRRRVVQIFVGTVVAIRSGNEVGVLVNQYSNGAKLGGVRY